MKFASTLAVLVLLFLSPGAGAQTADDQYVGIYNLIQQGDALNENGQLSAALAKYARAQSDLKDFQAANPDWNVKVVSFRSRYLAVKVELISSELTSANAPAATAPAASPVVAAVTPPPAPINNSDQIIQALQQQLRAANMDRVVLQAKLQEALSAQPAAVDPREFSQAQAQIVELQKENDLLKVKLEQSQTGQASTNALALADAKQDLAVARRQVTALTAVNTALAAENVNLRVRAKKPAAADADTIALQEENAVLRKQVAALQKSPGGGDIDQKLREAQAQVAALESDKQVLGLENTALQMRVTQLQATPTALMAGAPPGTVDASAARIKELEAERDELQVKLDRAMSQIADGKSKNEPAKLADANRQLEALQARIDILEAHPNPYTPEELEMLSKSQGTMLVAAVHRTGKRSVKELTPEAIALLAEAKRAVANQDYAGAEDKYLEILKTNEKNPAVLTDLASIEVSLNHADDAEKHIKAALALDPDNAYSLFVLGRLRLTQGKYDDALEALSHAAEINPDDAQIQNNLGVALSEKGLRVPAEAALRKAVQIDPGCADAHANLAFVYITQQPPLVELARWHYEKALEAGHPHVSAIEKLIAQSAAPASPNTQASSTTQ
jgi:tetratricopeptide (TPR) repeat protein